MSIPKAYCIEAERVLDIFEAHDLYFAQREPKEFDFRCPDEDCRKELNPRILGINYMKNSEIDDFVQRPHFRFLKGSPHIEECPWSEVTEAIEEIEKEDGIKGNLKHLKKSEIINAFKPIFDDVEDAKGQLDIDAAFLLQNRLLGTKRERLNNLKGHLRSSLNNTSRLHEVVRCFQSMTEDERRAALLAIHPHGSKTYRQWFRSAQFCRHTERSPYIYYGWANLRQYPTGYSIRFRNQAEQRNGPICSIFSFIPIEKIQASRSRNMLVDTLRTALQRQENQRYPIQAYIFGKGTLSDRPDTLGNRIDIPVDSLHSIVVILTENGA